MKCSATSEGRATGASRMRRPALRQARDHVARREHELVVLGAEVLRDLRRAAAARCARSPAKPSEKVPALSRRAARRAPPAPPSRGRRRAARRRPSSICSFTASSSLSMKPSTGVRDRAWPWRGLRSGADPVARSRAACRTATARGSPGRACGCRATACAGPARSGRRGSPSTAPRSTSGLQPRRLQQRLDLGGEEQRAVLLAEVQRLLAEAVAREQQALLARVPDREGEARRAGASPRRCPSAGRRAAAPRRRSRRRSDSRAASSCARSSARLSIEPSKASAMPAAAS